MEQAIRNLIKSNGTPFYLFDEKGFIDNYRKLEGIFKAIYPNYQLSYSYKTNYTPFVCQLVRSLGGYAEVVSDMEYTLAKKLGYDNKQIVYNGPSKGEEMFDHLEHQGILNIDSLDEAKRIVSYVKGHPDRNYTVGIRINMHVGGDFISRFGLVPESKELQETVSLIKETVNLNLIGLHCHISRSRGVEAWTKRTEIMLKAADDYIDGVPAYISLGSGMYADMPEFLKQQFGGDTVPTYEDYADCTIQPFADHYKDVENQPILFTEPGTTVVARYLSFVTKVLSVKEVRGRYIANMDIMGFTCLEQDVLYPGFEQSIAEGDILVFDNVGGYSIVSKPQFIKPQSAMYVLRTNGEVEQIMRAETFDDVFNKFSFKF